MKKTLIAGNWKMNGSLAANEALVLALRSGLPSTVACDVALCVPFVYLAQAQALLAGSGLGLGGRLRGDQWHEPVFA
jgi:triosephosphate isomerase